MGYEEDYLENNSYWDIDILNEYNKPIKDKINKWKEKQKNSNWVYKWYCQIQINKLEKQIQHYQ